MLQPVAGFPLQSITGTATRPAVTPTGADTFGSMITQTGLESIQKLQSAEQLSMQALTGDVGVREVASSVMAAEQALQLSMAVRDKIVTAFLDLSRMQI